MTAVVWSKDQCGYCVMAKNLLKNKGVEFEERNISYKKEENLGVNYKGKTVGNYRPDFVVEENKLGSEGVDCP